MLLRVTPSAVVASPAAARAVAAAAAAHLPASTVLANRLAEPIYGKKMVAHFFSSSSSSSPNDPTLMNDAFDESDAIETEKKKTMATTTTFSTREEEKSDPPTVRALKEERRRKQLLRREGGFPVFRPLFGRVGGGGFDDLFAVPTIRDPFLTHPFFFNRFPTKTPSLLSRAFDDEDLWTDIMPVLRRRRGGRVPGSGGGGFLRAASPGYEIEERDGTYEISVDVPDGVCPDDMTVEVEDDGSVLHVSGRRRTENDEGTVVSETRFDKSFTIGPNVDVERLTASFQEEDGVLVLSAPKLAIEGEGAEEQEETPSRRRIEITKAKALPLGDEEIAQKTFGDAFDESDWAEAGKKQTAV